MDGIWIMNQDSNVLPFLYYLLTRGRIYVAKHFKGKEELVIDEWLIKPQEFILMDKLTLLLNGSLLSESERQ